MSRDESRRVRTIPPEGADTGLTLLADTLPRAQTSAVARSRFVNELRERERFVAHVPTVSASFGLSVDDVRDALRRIADASAWTPGFWPDSQRLVTPALLAAHTMIARLPPGIDIAQHTHPCRELTYVLDGVLLEDERTEHTTRSLLDMAPGSAHALRVVRDHCLVVFALRRS